jgi:hypothetical protein
LRQEGRRNRRPYLRQHQFWRLGSRRAERLLAVREHADDLHRLMPVFEERHELSRRKVEATQRLQRLVSHPHDGGFGLNPESDVHVIEQQKLVDRLTADVARIETRYQRTSQAFQTTAQVRGSVEAWLRGRPHGTAVEDAPTERLSCSRAKAFSTTSRVIGCASGNYAPTRIGSRRTRAATAHPFSELEGVPTASTGPATDQKIVRPQSFTPS